MQVTLMRGPNNQQVCRIDFVGSIPRVGEEIEWKSHKAEERFTSIVSAVKWVTGPVSS